MHHEMTYSKDLNDSFGFAKSFSIMHSALCIKEISNMLGNRSVFKG